MNLLRSVSLGLATAAAATLSAAAPPAHAAGPGAELAELRSATVQFKALDHAFIAGWTEDITGCLSSPDGGMGHHFVNSDALLDGGVVDARQPELLVYAPDDHGGLKLVAVEYLVFADEVPSGSPVPQLFGENFHINPAINAWVLHAWVWQHNPDGMFADWNPDVSCD